jgi:hypothetical protein
MANNVFRSHVRTSLIPYRVDDADVFFAIVAWT